MDSARVPSTIRRQVEIKHARKLKLAQLAFLVMAMVATVGSLRAQEVDEHARLVELGLRQALPDSPAPQLATATVKVEASHGHHWLSLPTVALIGAEVATRSLDAASTRANIGNPCHCFTETQIGRLADTDGRMWSYSLGVAGAVIGGSYLLHRMGWHRLERVPMMVDVAWDGQLGVRNLAIRGDRPATGPIGKLPIRGVTR